MSKQIDGPLSASHYKFIAPNCFFFLGLGMVGYWASKCQTIRFFGSRKMRYKPNNIGLLDKLALHSNISNQSTSSVLFCIAANGLPNL